MPAHDVTIYGRAKEIIDGIALTLSKGEEGIYDLSGRKINSQRSPVNSQLRKGINIIRYSDGTTKKVLVK